VIAQYLHSSFSARCIRRRAAIFVVAVAAEAATVLSGNPSAVAFSCNISTVVQFVWFRTTCESIQENRGRSATAFRPVATEGLMYFAPPNLKTWLLAFKAHSCVCRGQCRIRKRAHTIMYISVRHGVAGDAVTSPTLKNWPYSGENNQHLGKIYSYIYVLVS